MLISCRIYEKKLNKINVYGCIFLYLLYYAFFRKGFEGFLSLEELFLFKFSEMYKALAKLFLYWTMSSSFFKVNCQLRFYRLT